MINGRTSVARSPLRSAKGLGGAAHAAMTSRSWSSIRLAWSAPKARPTARAKAWTVVVACRRSPTCCTTAPDDAQAVRRRAGSRNLLTVRRTWASGPIPASSTRTIGACMVTGP